MGRHSARWCRCHHCSDTQDASASKWQNCAHADAVQCSATPRRLHKQNIVPTPACSFFGCEEADVIHIAYHFPRCQFIRDEWSDTTHTWPFWLACAQQCLIATTTIPMHTRKNWSTVQQDIARLFETWMASRSNGNLAQNITCESHALEVERDESSRALHPDASFAAFEKYAALVQPPVTFPTRSIWLDLDWKPPNSSWALHKWGASFKDYCVLFPLGINGQRNPTQLPLRVITGQCLIFMQLGG